MKVTITLLFITMGLMCSTYAAPAPTKAEIQLISSLLADIVKTVPKIIKVIKDGGAQDYDVNNTEKNAEIWIKGG